jgi:hypothetical protein
MSALRCRISKGQGVQCLRMDRLAAKDAAEDGAGNHQGTEARPWTR